MESERRKVYVEVNVTHRPDGTARPNFIKFENYEKYENCKCKLDTRMIKIVQRKPALSITQQARLALSRMP